MCFHPSKEGFKGGMLEAVSEIDEKRFHPSKEGFKVRSAAWLDAVP